MSTPVPLSVSDLTYITKRLKEWERLLVKDGIYTNRADLITRIEVTRPFDQGEIIGHFVLYDGWVGFQFQGVTL